MPACTCACARTAPDLCPRCAPGRYLITHAPDCGCRERLPHTCQESSEAAVFLWGRDVSLHTVYDGECPYQFQTGDCEAIALILWWYPSQAVRHVLPLHITVAALHAHGLYRSRVDHGEVLCVIGDPSHE